MNPIKKLAVVIVAIGSVSALVLSPSLAVAKTKLGELECGPNEIAKSDGTDWFCADDLNELSQAIDEIGEFGCSATQQDNSVLITCGDGTAGVIAGAGTVVLYPEGQIGQVPPIDYNTGPIVLVDASGNVLGVAKSYSNIIIDTFDISLGDDSPFVVARLVNIHSTEHVEISGLGGRIYFQSEDCSGPAFSSGGEMVEVDNRFFTIAQWPATEVLFRSWYDTGYWWWGEGLQYRSPTECESGNWITYAAPVVEYLFPPEIVNAVYPLRVEQLP
jgi:hypothetical protein